MAQTTLDDDELFTEAASEMREDVESSLTAARAALPDPDEVWEIDAENVLGALNELKSALNTDDAGEKLREAKKWYTLGTEADAFDDPEELAAAIEKVEELVTDIEAAHEQVGDLTGTVPQLRGALQDAEKEAGGDSDADTEAAEA